MMQKLHYRVPYPMPFFPGISTALEMTEMPEQAEDEAIELGMTGEGKEIPGQFIAHGLKL